MDLQFYGANCLTINLKGARIVIDDTLAELGGKSILKADDVALYTGPHGSSGGRICFDIPGEYEAADASIIGIPARAHMDEPKQHSATIFKVVVGEISVVVVGHIYPDLSEAQLEQIGLIDVLVVPVGGNGYTLDPVGALKLIKDIEPKIVIPTHYADSSLNFEVPQQSLQDAIKELGMEPKETVAKLKIKSAELTDTAQLIVLEKS